MRNLRTAAAWWSAPDVGRAEVGDRESGRAEHIQGEVAVPAVVGVEVPALLGAVDGVIGGVQVEGELGRSVGGSGRPRADRPGRRRVGTVSGGRPGSRAGTGWRPSRAWGRVRGRVRGGRWPCATGGVGAEGVVVVEVLAPAGDGEHPLGREGPLRVGDAVGPARVRAAGVREGVDESELAIGMAEQEYAGVGGDGPTGEVGDDLSGGRGWRTGCEWWYDVSRRRPPGWRGWCVVTGSCTGARAVALADHPRTW